MPGTILVTGAAGFAGSHLLDLPAGTPVLSRGTAPAGERRTARAGSRGRQSICSIRRLFTARSRRCGRRSCTTAPAPPTSGSPGSDTARTLAINVRGTHHLLEGLRRAALAARVRDSRAPRMVYAAADEPLTEEDPLVPRSPVWSQQARAGDGRRCARDLDGLHVTIARAFNHFGPRQDPFFAASGFAQPHRRHRSGPTGAGDRSRQPRRAPRSHRRARYGSRLPADSRARHSPAAPYNVCSGRAITIRRTARPPARARACADPRARRSGALPPERRAAAARGSNAGSQTSSAGSPRSRSTGPSTICSTIGEARPPA